MTVQFLAEKTYYTNAQVDLQQNQQHFKIFGPIQSYPGDLLFLSAPMILITSQLVDSVCVSERFANCQRKILLARYKISAQQYVRTPVWSR